MIRDTVTRPVLAFYFMMSFLLHDEKRANKNALHLLLNTIYLRRTKSDISNVSIDRLSIRVSSRGTTFICRGITACDLGYRVPYWLEPSTSPITGAGRLSSTLAEAISSHSFSGFIRGTVIRAFHLLPALWMIRDTVTCPYNAFAI